MKRQDLYRDRIVCIFFVFILFAVLELAARLVFTRQGGVEEIIGILQQDPVLFWRQRPNLKTIFKNTKLETNSLGLRNEDIKSEKGVFRIVCLGASPTFGWGVEAEDAYPAQMERLLKEKYGPGRGIEVINAGVIGYTSHQGLIFLKKEIMGLSPDLVTVSLVINDVDKHRFYRSNGKSDKELAPKSKILVAMENLLDKSDFFKLLKRVIINSKGAAARYFGEETKSGYSESRRVSAEDYRKNLDAIIDLASQCGIRVVFIKMPLNLPSQEEVPEPLLSEADARLEQALAYAKDKKYERAISGLKEATAYNPYSSRALYYLGIYSEKKGRYKEAEGYFQRAKEAELFQCQRLARTYNEIMESVAREREIPLVDIVSAFDEAARKDGRYLFLDAEGDSIHPNPAGHKIISQRIYQLLREPKLL